MLVEVIRNDLNRAIRQLKRLLNKDGWYSDLERHEEYEKPSERRRRKKQEARKKAKKLAQVRARGDATQHTGYEPHYQPGHQYRGKRGGKNAR